MHFLLFKIDIHVKNGALKSSSILLIISDALKLFLKYSIWYLIDYDMYDMYTL